MGGCREAGRPVEKIVVLGGVANERVMLSESGPRRCCDPALGALDLDERLLEDTVGDGSYLFRGAHPARERDGAGLLNDPGGVPLCDAEDAPHAFLRDSSLLLEETRAQLVRAGTHGLRLREQIRRLARGIEWPLVQGETECPGGRPAVDADQGLGLEIPDLELQIVDAHEDLTSDRRRARGVACPVRRDRRVILDGANPLREVPER